MVTGTDVVPSLAAGRGLPGRQIVLCDGRTSLRFEAEPEGFTLLVHYARGSWKGLHHVLRMPGTVSNSGVGLGERRKPALATLSVDGRPHHFDWVEVWPYALENREGREGGPIVSRWGIVQGGLQWVVRGARQSVTLAIPRAMFVSHENRKDGRLLDQTEWTFGPGGAGVWHAVRREQWTFRDNSTFAGIAGGQIKPETPRQSELHLTVGANSAVVSEVDDDVCRFTATASGGPVVLAIGLGGDEAEAAQQVTALTADPDRLAEQQRQRYAAVAKQVPALEFGRHTALRRFFGIQPHMLEAMRVADEPGAFRGNNEYHWVWEWDMARPAVAIAESGRHDFVRALMDFYDRTGYCNEYDSTLTRNLRVTGEFPDEPTPLSFMLAHAYLSWSGNLDSTRRWRDGFVKAIRTRSAAAAATGMIPDIAKSSDYPEEFGRTFKGWLAYTTGWEYAGYLSAEKLLLAWGENNVAEQARDLAARIRRNFARVFWNPCTGFWNEGVHPTDPDLVCDIPLSTAMSAMDSPYGEDLYGDKLDASAAFARKHFLREDGVHITMRGETRGWKEWTRQANNWFAANDTQLARLFRAVGDAEALEQLFYLYEINFGYQPAAFEGKPFRRPLHTSGSWHVFAAGAWYRNLLECAAGLWADLGGLGVMPCGLGEPIRLTGLTFRTSRIDFAASGVGRWPTRLALDGRPLVGTMRLPTLSAGSHQIEVEYGPAIPQHPVLVLAVDAAVGNVAVTGDTLTATLTGRGYTPIRFFAPSAPSVTLDGQGLSCQWNPDTGRGWTRCVLRGEAAELRIHGA